MSIYICIKTDSPKADISIFDNLKKLNQISWRADRQLAETLHLKIIEFLKLQRLSLDNLEGIVVYRGPGSYTGLRIGISTSNALASGLGIPIVGGQGLNWQKDAIGRLVVGENDKVVLPIYENLPKTTMPSR